MLGQVPVYYKESPQSNNLQEAAKVFKTRAQYSELIKDTKHAVTQLKDWKTDLSSEPNNTGPGVLALGASPKLVKWALKDQGFKVATVNASKIKPGMVPTQEFNEYLARKLGKLGQADSVILMDFADSGGSLLKIKEDVKALRRNGTVEPAETTETVHTVALGTSPGFHGEANEANKALIDKVVTDIPNLQHDLDKQRLKNFVLGRNKQKNDYDSWKNTTAATRDERMINGKRSHELYQQQKTLLRQALGLDVLNVKTEDFIQSNGSDTEFESDGSVYSVQGSEHGGSAKHHSTDPD
jgi:hypothetical protein